MKPRLAICISSLGATDKEVKTALKNARYLSKFFTIVVDKRVIKNDIFDSRSVQERITSINWAAKNADIIMPWNGGYNSIELLFEFGKLIKNFTPDKLFVGYSDNTILTNALATKGICRTAQGPGLYNWLKCPENDQMWAESLLVIYNKDYSRLTKQYNSLPITIFRTGTMSAQIIGGNNYTFDLLQGTDFAPTFRKPFTLLLEGENFITDRKRVWQDFIRNLDSILLQPGAKDNIRGLLIGRFPAKTSINIKEIIASLQERKYLADIPIAYNFARGYHSDMLYLPIGENLVINLDDSNNVKIAYAK